MISNSGDIRPSRSHAEELTVSPPSESPVRPADSAEAIEGLPAMPLPGVRVVRSGVLRIMELEEQGGSYFGP
ncbi:MAG TPA: hypothetical protein VFF67_00995 [Thermoplasmata archaeon]|nr:hypothetical protein [Thermoplasmata archaeon]